MPTQANPITLSIGFFLTIFIFGLFTFVHIHFKKVWTNPMILSMVCIPIVLYISKIPLETYQAGANLISFFIGPATIALAVPMAKQFTVLKKHAGAILFGAATGSLFAFMFNFLLAYWLHLPKSLIVAMTPKSVTTPIAIEVTNHFHGDPALTTGMVVSTGIIGMIFAQFILNFSKIKDPLSRGVAMGVSFHAIGIVRAQHEGELTGAVSSICIALAGIFTTLIAPFLFPLLSRLF